MATSTILLGLIAFSCFQTQNARRLRDDISQSFYNAVQTLKLIKKTGTVITQEEQKLLRHAIANVDEFDENIERFETRANSELRETDASETCKSKAATLLIDLRSELRNDVARCSEKYKEEIKETADIARRALSTGWFIVGSPDRLVEKFRACEDDECLKVGLAEAESALAEEEDLAKKVYTGSYWTNAQVMSDFKQECLMKGEEDYRRLAKHVIELAETCEDT